MTVVGDHTARSVWRSRNFRLAWAGGFVNDTGDWVLTVALPVYVFTETGSGISTAGLFACQLAVAALLGPFGGSLVDRWDLRRTLIVTNLAQAVMVVPLLAVTPSRVWPAYVVVTVQAVLTQLNNPANVAILPRLVEPGQLIAANAALSASTSLARLVGSPVGGILVAAGGLIPVIALDAVSFLAVALAISRVRADTGPSTTQDEPAGVWNGLRALRHNPPLPAVLTVHGFSQIAQGAFIVLFVVFIVDTLGGDGTDVGVIRGAMAVGAIVGAALIGRLGHRVSSLRLLALGYFGMGITALVFWNAPQVTTAVWVYVALFALTGLPGAALGVGLFTTVQTLAPPGALGRITGVLLAAEAVGAALGAIVAGLLVEVVPLTALLDAQAATYVACGLPVLAVIRRAHRRRLISADAPQGPQRDFRF